MKKNAKSLKNFVVTIGILLVITSFQSLGSGTAYLICKSESGRTLFNAELQDIDGILENAVLEIDGVKLNFNEEDISQIILDSKNGVFTISTENKYNEQKSGNKINYLKFWAIPKTFEIITNNESEQIYRFKEKVQASEPRKNKDLQTPIIELNCELKYKI